MKCGKCGTTEIDFNFIKGKISCNFCGNLIDENISNPEIYFEPKKNGQKEIRGQIIQKTSHLNNEKSMSPTLLKFGIRRKMAQLGNQLRISNENIESAFELFIFSVQNKLKSNKNLHSLSISCLYAVCRKEKTPHLLIDFSDISQTRSSKIGVEFLKFLKFTRLPLPVIDPSVYIHRFVSKLELGEKTIPVTMSALRLIARMKRNWISTGRKPTGLCGAAILLSTRIHGIKKNQQEICHIVRIGIQALRCRLFEVEKTSIKKFNIERLEKGGGSDGKRESLLDVDLDEEKNTIIKNKNIKNKKKLKKEERFVPIYINENKMEKKINFLDRKKSKFFFKKKKETSNFLLYYINSEFEILIKEQIWERMNSDFTNYQAIRSRIQKEKPFAFFGNKKTRNKNHQNISKI
jgi:transcription initiation factor TFIIIB Brf1 subunit/transcription initiation factor TFIIB